MAMRASAMAIRRNTLQARPVARRLSTAVAPRTGVASRPVEGGRPCNPPGVIKEFVTAPVSFGKEYLFEVTSLARWGVVAGIALYMMVRPKEWMEGWTDDWNTDQYFAYRFPHVPRESVYDPETGKLVYKGKFEG